MTPADDDVDGGAEAEKPKGDVSEKQLKFIRSLQQRIGLGEEELEAVLTDVCGAASLDDLSRKDASNVIDELQVKAREKGIDLDAQPLASEKQVGFMKQLKRRAHLTDDEFAALLQDRAGVTTPEEVGKRDASAVIDELLAMADGKKDKPGATATKKAAPEKKPAGDKKAPAKKKVLEGSRPAALGKKPVPAAKDEDDGAPPPKAPPAGDDDFEPGANDGPDDEDLDRDPGDAGDDDLPF
jgi:hypothetical protein